MTFIGKEWDPETWGGDVWQDSKAEKLEPSDSQGFISLKEVVPLAPPP